MDTPRTPQEDIEAEIRRQVLTEQERERMIRNAARQFPASRTAPQPSFVERMKNKGGLIGGIFSLFLLIAKFFAPVLSLLKFAVLGKYLLTGGSMLLSIALQATLYGWPMAVGIVFMIFLHECGHALAGKSLGHPIGPMVFIPFMGAFVMVRGGKNLGEDAFVGIMGPVVGALYGLVCVGLYFVTGWPFWLALASITFFINLFNLLPTPPLDGGWIAPLFSPKLMALGMVLLIPIALKNPLILLLALSSLPRIIAGWKADPRTQPYYRATNKERWRYGLSYVGLVLLLGLGMVFTDQYRASIMPPVA